jgi:hypothetical protein
LPWHTALVGRNQFDITEQDMAELRVHLDKEDSVRTPKSPVDEKKRRLERKTQKEADALAKATALAEDKRLWEEQTARSRDFFAKAGLDWNPTWTHPLFRLYQQDYPAYLQTREWKVIRRRVLKRDKGLCQLCVAKAQCVHHISYDEEVILGERDEDLISLCDPCHQSIEFDGERHRTDAEKLGLLQERQAISDPQEPPR